MKAFFTIFNLCFLAAIASAQGSFTIHYDFNNTMGGTATSPVVTNIGTASYAAAITNEGFDDDGAGNIGSASSNWGTSGAYDPAKYLSFSITVTASTQNVILDNMNINLKRDGNGPASAKVFYTANGGPSTEIAYNNNGISTVYDDFGVFLYDSGGDDNFLIPAGTSKTFVFSIHAFQAVTATDWLYLNDITINGQLPLPIRLLSFEGVQQQNSVLLNWRTDYEADFAYFAIERSLDGVSYQMIGSLPGQGKAHGSANRYAFVDQNITPELKGNTVYYRLRLQDKNGFFDYSNTIAIRIRTDNNQLDFTALQPRPGEDAISLAFFAPEAGTVTVRVTDLNGRNLATRIIPSVSGINFLDLDLNHTSYYQKLLFVTLSTDQDLKTRKFFK